LGRYCSPRGGSLLERGAKRQAASGRQGGAL